MVRNASKASCESEPGVLITERSELYGVATFVAGAASEASCVFESGAASEASCVVDPHRAKGAVYLSQVHTLTSCVVEPH